MFPALSITLIVTEFFPLLETGIGLSRLVSVCQLPVPPISYSYFATPDGVSSILSFTFILTAPLYQPFVLFVTFSAGCMLLSAKSVIVGGV